MTIHNGQKWRLSTIRQHRLDYYDRAIQKLIDGEVGVEYVTKRAEKVKEVLNGRH